MRATRALGNLRAISDKQLQKQNFYSKQETDRVQTPCVNRRTLITTNTTSTLPYLKPVFSTFEDNEIFKLGAVFLFNHFCRSK